MGAISDALGGSRTDVLRALRVKVASELDSPDLAAREVASLSRQLRDLTAELDALDSGKEPSLLDSFLGTSGPR